VPRWLSLAYTVFVAVLVPAYWLHYGPQNFLWACDIALLATVAALWRASAWIASTLAVAVLLPELGWNADFFGRLVTGRDIFGFDATGYMFDPTIPRFVRSLSLFHVLLPLLLLWLVHRLGYDRRALATATLVTWVVLPVCYFFTEPARNINWVFGLNVVPQQWMPGAWYLAVMMLLVPVLLYLPAHLLLRRFRGRPEAMP